MASRGLVGVTDARAWRRGITDRAARVIAVGSGPLPRVVDCRVVVLYPPASWSRHLVAAARPTHGPVRYGNLELTPAELPVCRSAAHVQRILRTAFMGTETIVLVWSSPLMELKSRLISHWFGDTPPLRSCHPGCQISVGVFGEMA